ncbi:hypothetical protein TWF506_007399 [Arthrobotrys conoides]|uniref:Chromatin remodeling factor mit1 n=1 Tax=Arthrobotrys conoides TaxID=74498 RepID=A0AAN8NEJ4_9PEZI
MEEEERGDPPLPESSSPPPAGSLSIAIEIPPLEGNRDDYPFYEADNSSIQRIVAERDRDGEQQYRVLSWDGELNWLPWDVVIGMDFGNEALTEFEQRPRLGYDGAGNDSDNYTDEGPIVVDSDDEEMTGQNGDEEEDSDEHIRRPTRQKSTRRSTRSSTAASSIPAQSVNSQSRRLKVSARQAALREQAQNKLQKAPRSRNMTSNKPTRITRASARNAGRLISQAMAKAADFDDHDSDSSETSEDIIVSDLQDTPSHWKKRGRRAAKVVYDSDEDISKRGRKRESKKRVRSESEDEDREETRKSGRTRTFHGSLKELDEDDIEAVEVKASAPRVVYQQEVFKEFSRDSQFSQVHTQWCDACSEPAGRQKGPLVLCQGCSSAFHKGCIGNRASREHLVTKLSDHQDRQFVLQCKRCIRKAHKIDKRPPRLDVCTQCRSVGRSSEPFRKIPVTKAEKEETPEVSVPGFKINNPENVLFRCCKCHRACHFHHLPQRGNRDTSQASTGLGKVQLNQYNSDWMCLECVNMGDRKVGDLVAWRPSDDALKESKDTFDSGIHEFDHDEIEYLIRLSGDDYSKAKWYPGAWVYTIAFPAMRIAFEKNDPAPKWTSSDAIPESYFRIDIIFDVTYTSIVPNMTESIEKQRIREIVKVFVKFKGLGYEEAMWIPPPSEEEEERYADFKRAYFEYCKGNHVRLPRGVFKTIQNLREKFKTNFNPLEIKTQPKYISGGTLKDYQIEGMNWLYYRWFLGKNAILADEMGLGKTIQIISFLEVLRQEHKVWPCLVVAPHSTVPNWVREIRTWAPGMRVVAFFGSAESLKLTKKYELFSSAPSASARDLKCHIVVSSYQAIADHSSILKAVPWQVLVVDEGQRLKSDETILYKELSSFRFQHKVLLTGTPLQNNIRELFNLLQFLDPVNVNAKELEEEFSEVTKENLNELHERIRPYFLRRTKAQALKDLPPISDVIIPLTVTKLQQELLKSIYSKDAELLRAIMAKSGGQTANRSKLNNIVMQLRKVLCHPFVYDQNVEEKLQDQQLLHRNLVDASCKLKFLELILPKLHEKGHRVLMFSQFLGMLDIMEDFLNGLGLQTLRLDGSNDTAEKQKLIDAYNAPESPYFAFILSTRAGGVGINLASADTVIILDPDWNPHQDLQAIARAHRIGQKKKVLVFHLMTARSCEEKMLRMAKDKLGLDHIVIQRMGAEGQEEEEKEVDVASVLAYGAEDIVKGEVKDIIYTPESIDKLLDRDHMKNTIGEQEVQNERDAQFSFARVWATVSGERAEIADEPEEDQAPDLDLWGNIIQQRLDDAAREKAAKMAEYGRGRRKIVAANYVLDEEIEDDSDSESRGKLDEDVAHPQKAKKAKKATSDDDTDFLETGGETGGESDADSGTECIPFHPGELEGPKERSRSVLFNGGHRVGSPSGSTGPVSEQGSGPGIGVDAIHPEQMRTQHPVDMPPMYPQQQMHPQQQMYPSQQAFPPHQIHPQQQMHPPQQMHMPQQINASEQPQFMAQVPPRGTINPPGDPSQITNPQELQPGANARITPILSNYPQPAYGTFSTAPHGQVPGANLQYPATYQAYPLPPPPPPGIPVQCRLCTNTHMPGECPLRNIPVEYCQLCGIAHFGEGSICPHLSSVTQINAMLEAMKESNEPPHLKALAKNVLRNRKGAIIQSRKLKKAKAERVAAEMEAAKELARKGT